MNSYEDIKFFDMALEEARIACKEEEIPVGAVVVMEGQVIARDHNRVEQLKDATAHAEMLVLENSFKAAGDWRLNGATVYVTLQPCIMCTGALHLARILNLVFGAYRKTIAERKKINSLFDKGIMNHQMGVTGGIKRLECEDLMDTFFAWMREDNKDGAKIIFQ